ncbi:MAG TPA: BON domain-containing protein [Alphaproteobacteria bacterium]|nr:BON domain-containing protein [Alphaproteobacteria bacterium]
MGLSSFRPALFVATLLTALPAQAQLLDILSAPKTLVDRAIEARSASDIAKDNEVVLKVNGVMADVGTVKASTEIYEQRLLITGLFDNKAAYDKFEKGVRNVRGVKQLLWHVTYMPKADQEKNKLMDWPDVVAMEAKARGRLIGTAGVADVNFRVTGDASGTLYVLGRARSADEMDKAIKRLWDGENVKKVVNYIQVRP